MAGENDSERTYPLEPMAPGSKHDPNTSLIDVDNFISGSALHDSQSSSKSYYFRSSTDPAALPKLEDAEARETVAALSSVCPSPVYARMWTTSRKTDTLLLNEAFLVLMVPGRPVLVYRSGLRRSSVRAISRLALATCSGSTTDMASLVEASKEAYSGPNGVECCEISQSEGANLPLLVLTQSFAASGKHRSWFVRQSERGEVLIRALPIGDVPQTHQFGGPATASEALAVKRVVVPVTVGNESTRESRLQEVGYTSFSFSATCDQSQTQPSSSTSIHAQVFRVRNVFLPRSIPVLGNVPAKVVECRDTVARESAATAAAEAIMASMDSEGQQNAGHGGAGIDGLGQEATAPSPEAGSKERQVGVGSLMAKVILGSQSSGVQNSSLPILKGQRSKEGLGYSQLDSGLWVAAAQCPSDRVVSVTLQEESTQGSTLSSSDKAVETTDEDYGTEDPALGDGASLTIQQGSESSSGVSSKTHRFVQRTRVSPSCGLSAFSMSNSTVATVLESTISSLGLVEGNKRLAGTYRSICVFTSSGHSVVFGLIREHVTGLGFLGDDLLVVSTAGVRASHSESSSGAASGFGRILIYSLKTTVNMESGASTALAASSSSSTSSLTVELLVESHKQECVSALAVNPVNNLLLVGMGHRIMGYVWDPLASRLRGCALHDGKMHVTNMALRKNYALAGDMVRGAELIRIRDETALCKSLEVLGRTPSLSAGSKSTALGTSFVHSGQTAGFVTIDGEGNLQVSDFFPSQFGQFLRPAVPIGPSTPVTSVLEVDSLSQQETTSSQNQPVGPGFIQSSLLLVSGADGSLGSLRIISQENYHFLLALSTVLSSLLPAAAGSNPRALLIPRGPDTYKWQTGPVAASVTCEPAWAVERFLTLSLPLQVQVAAKMGQSVHHIRQLACSLSAAGRALEVAYS